MSQTENILVDNIIINELNYSTKFNKLKHEFEQIDLTKFNDDFINNHNKIYSVLIKQLNDINKDVEKYNRNLFEFKSDIKENEFLYNDLFLQYEREINHLKRYLQELKTLVKESGLKSLHAS
jgi:hypothetical protein